MKAFYDLTHCPKCDDTKGGWDLEYVSNFGYLLDGEFIKVSSSGQEAVVHTCDRCGYKEATTPADAEERE